MTDDRLEQIKGVYFGEREPACTHQIFYTGCDMCSRSWLISELEQAAAREALLLRCVQYYGNVHTPTCREVEGEDCDCGNRWNYEQATSKASEAARELLEKARKWDEHDKDFSKCHALMKAAYDDCAKERDALRAEVERLKAEAKRAHHAFCYTDTRMETQLILEGMMK
jgi:hypothetical protein